MKHIYIFLCLFLLSGVVQAGEMGAQEKIMRLIELKGEIDKRILELQQGGVPQGARQSMGGGVGPDVPPVTIFSNSLLSI